MTSYYTNDIPSIEIEIIPEHDGEPLPATFTYATPDVYAPDGSKVTVAGFYIKHDDDTDEWLFGWPLEAPFTMPGIYTVVPTFHGYGNAITQIDPVLVVVQEHGPWHSLYTARLGWPGAPVDDAELYQLLEIAKGQVLDYAPERFSTALAEIPPAFRRAQLMQARNIWNATKVDENNGIGGEGFSLTVFPMDWSVKNLIRPKRGVGFVR